MYLRAPGNYGTSVVLVLVLTAIALGLVAVAELLAG